ncbi:MAG: hypothetical protein PHH83_04280 [Patescibacteria group bacterium]|nr:hypothetical protein [Patescibacteria group bacterium]
MSNLKEYGMKGLGNKSRCPKSNPNETSIFTRCFLIELMYEENLFKRFLGY